MTARFNGMYFWQLTRSQKEQFNGFLERNQSPGVPDDYVFYTLDNGEDDEQPDVMAWSDKFPAPVIYHVGMHWVQEQACEDCNRLISIETILAYQEDSNLQTWETPRICEDCAELPGLSPARPQADMVFTSDHKVLHWYQVG